MTGKGRKLLILAGLILVALFALIWQHKSPEDFEEYSEEAYPIGQQEESNKRGK